ncbi:NADHX dehydratase [Saccharomyces cerevisiae]|nr:NADHX dehydratase [Saccharomyces cerevisiae]
MLAELSHRELIKLAQKRCIPPLLPKFHKGQSGGRVCIIGGCEDYTGAPYFSANATALMGCDLTHVICEYNAGTVIKSYTPNLMVHPYLRMSNTKLDVDMDEQRKKINSLLDRIHVVVIGPGLGRDPLMLKSIKDIIRYILEKHEGKIPLVIDADGLFLVTQDSEVKEMLKSYPKGRVILTPNVVEFKRLCDAIGKKGDSHSEMGSLIAQELNCQGDTLTGAISCMLAFSRAMYDFKICDQEEKGESNDKPLKNWVDYAMLSCYAGCTITRECSRLGFKAKGRAMQTTDLNDRVGEVFAKLFG